MAARHCVLGLVCLFALNNLRFAFVSTVQSSKKPLADVRVGEGRVYRIQVPPATKYSFFSVVQNVCVKDSLYNGPLRMYTKSDPHKLLEHYPPWGSTTELRESSWLGFSFRTFELVNSSISVPSQCLLQGKTLALENSAGAPGHIGHFAENVIKFFAFVPQLLNVKSLARVWLTGRGDNFPANDWEWHFLKASLGLSASDPMLPVFSSTHANHLKSLGCQQVCFDEVIFAQAAQQWAMSYANADEVRLRTWRYCKISPRSVDAQEVPRFLYLPRFRTRKVLNAAEVTNLARTIGFDVEPEVKNLTSFCAQVALLERSDVILATHGSHLTNVLFMHPHTTVIECLSGPNFYWPCFKTLAIHSRINYLEWQNTQMGNVVSPADAKNTDFAINTTLIRPYLKFARSIWKTSSLLNHSCMRPSPIGWKTHNEIVTEKCTPSPWFHNFHLST